MHASLTNAVAVEEQIRTREFASTKTRPTTLTLSPNQSHEGPRAVVRPNVYYGLYRVS